jgi:hypothetical protein
VPTLSWPRFRPASRPWRTLAAAVAEVEREDFIEQRRALRRQGWSLQALRLAWGPTESFRSVALLKRSVLARYLRESGVDAKVAMIRYRAWYAHITAGCHHDAAALLAPG